MSQEQCTGSTASVPPVLLAMQGLPIVIPLRSSSLGPRMDEDEQGRWSGANFFDQRRKKLQWQASCDLHGLLTLLAGAAAAQGGAW